MRQLARDLTSQLRPQQQQQQQQQRQEGDRSGSPTLQQNSDQNFAQETSMQQLARSQREASQDDSRTNVAQERRHNRGGGRNQAILRQSVQSGGNAGSDEQQPTFRVRVLREWYPLPTLSTLLNQKERQAPRQFSAKRVLSLDDEYIAELPRTLVLGVCGNGKSTLCSALCGLSLINRAFSIKEGMTAEGVTQDITAVAYKGRVYVDMPGLSDGDLRQDALHLQKTKQYLASVDTAAENTRCNALFLNQFLLVISAAENRISKMRTPLQLLENHFGQSFAKMLTVVISHADGHQTVEKQNEIVKMLQETLFDGIFHNTKVSRIDDLEDGDIACVFIDTHAAIADRAWKYGKKQRIAARSALEQIETQIDRSRNRFRTEYWPPVVDYYVGTDLCHAKDTAQPLTLEPKFRDAQVPSASSSDVLEWRLETSKEEEPSSVGFKVDPKTGNLSGTVMAQNEKTGEWWCSDMGVLCHDLKKFNTDCFPKRSAYKRHFEFKTFQQFHNMLKSVCRESGFNAAVVLHNQDSRDGKITGQVFFKRQAMENCLVEVGHKLDDPSVESIRQQPVTYLFKDPDYVKLRVVARAVPDSSPASEVSRSTEHLVWLRVALEKEEFRQRVEGVQKYLQKTYDEFYRVRKESKGSRFWQEELSGHPEDVQRAMTIMFEDRVRDNQLRGWQQQWSLLWKQVELERNKDNDKVLDRRGVASMLVDNLRSDLSRQFDFLEGELGREEELLHGINELCGQSGQGTWADVCQAQKDLGIMEFHGRRQKIANTGSDIVDKAREYARCTDRQDLVDEIRGLDPALQDRKRVIQDKIDELSSLKDQLTNTIENWKMRAMALDGNWTSVYLHTIRYWAYTQFKVEADLRLKVTKRGFAGEFIILWHRAGRTSEFNKIPVHLKIVQGRPKLVFQWEPVTINRVSFLVRLELPPIDITQATPGSITVPTDLKWGYVNTGYADNDASVISMIMERDEAE